MSGVVSLLSGGISGLLPADEHPHSRNIMNKLKKTFGVKGGSTILSLPSSFEIPD